MQDDKQTAAVGSYASVQGLERRVQQVEELLRAKRPSDRPASDGDLHLTASPPSLRALHARQQLHRPASAAAASTLLQGETELEVTGTLRLSGSLSPTRSRGTSHAPPSTLSHEPVGRLPQQITYDRVSVSTTAAGWHPTARPAPAPPPSNGVWEAQKNQVILQLARDLERAQALAQHAAAVVTSAGQASTTPPPARTLSNPISAPTAAGLQSTAPGPDAPAPSLPRPLTASHAGSAAAAWGSPDAARKPAPLPGSQRPGLTGPAAGRGLQGSGRPLGAAAVMGGQALLGFGVSTSSAVNIGSVDLPQGSTSRPSSAPPTRLLITSTATSTFGHQPPPPSQTMLPFDTLPRDPSPTPQPTVPIPTLPPHPLLAASSLFRSAAQPARSSALPTHSTTATLAGVLGTLRPASMVAAAVVAGAGTWEGPRGAALLSLEKEVKRLREYAQQQQEVEAGMRQAMAAAEVAAARKVERSLGVAAAALQQRAKRSLAASCWSAWRRRARQAARLQRGLVAWRRRMLRCCFQAWWDGMVEERQLASTRMAASIEAWRAKCAASRWEAQRLLLSGLQRGLRLLRAWREVVRRRQDKLRRYERMRRVWATRVAAQALARWRGEVLGAREQGLRLERRLRLDRAVGVVKAWRQLVDRSNRVEVYSRARMLLRCLRQWQRAVDSAAAVRRLIQLVSRRHLRNVLRCWRRKAARLAVLRPRLQAIEGAARERLARAVLRALTRHCSICKGARELAHSRAVVLLRGWQAAAQQHAQHSLVEAALRAAHARRTLRGCFGSWLAVVLETREERLQEACHQLRGEVQALASELEGTQKLRGAAQEQAAAARQHNHALQHAALSATVSIGADHLLSPSLAWKAVTPATPTAPPPAPRARHFAMALHAGLRDPPSLPEGGLSGSPRGGDVPAGGLHGYEVMVAVFGGTRQDTWLSDVEVVTASCGGCGDGAWTVDSQAAAPGQQPHGEGGADGGMSLRVDFAACGALDGRSFYVMGGFDGSQELQDLHCCRLQQQEVGSWQASWEQLQPRNRAPPPRSHHSLTLCPASGSLYAFGGHSSSGGLLNDLWAFHTGHREWWAPNTTGDAPSPRRGHVAVVCGGLLLVHGGFDGAGHLGDLHALDLCSWQWTQVACQGVVPSVRRGHAAAVVGERYLLVHGGYDGEQQLADAYVLDTHTRTWTLLQAAGTAAEVPSARALHSLVVAGPGAFMLGGVGPLGALGDMHLLLDSAIIQGEMLKADWVKAAAQLAESRSRCAALESALDAERAAAAAALSEAEEANLKLQQLAERYNQAVHDGQTLRDKLQRQRQATSAAEDAAKAAAQQLQALRRKLGRAEEGGVVLADAAEGLGTQLEAAGHQVARLEAALKKANTRAASSQQHAQRCSEESVRLQALAAAARADAAAATAGAEAMRAQCAAVLQEQAAVMRQQLELVREVALQREATAAASRPATAPAATTAADPSVPPSHASTSTSTPPSQSQPATSNTNPATSLPADCQSPDVAQKASAADPPDPVPAHLVAASATPPAPPPTALALLPQQLSQVVSDFASQFARAEGAETQLALLQQHARLLEAQLVSARIQASAAQRDAEVARQEADDWRLQLRSAEALQALELQQLRGQLALLRGAPAADGGPAGGLAGGGGFGDVGAAAAGGGGGDCALGGGGAVGDADAGDGAAGGGIGNAGGDWGCAAAASPADSGAEATGPQQRPAGPPRAGQHQHGRDSGGGGVGISSGRPPWGALVPRPGVGWVPDETLADVAWEVKQHVDMVQSRFGPPLADMQLDARSAPSWARPLLHTPRPSHEAAAPPALGPIRAQRQPSGASFSGHSPLPAPPPPSSPIRTPNPITSFDPLQPPPPVPASPNPPARPASALQPPFGSPPPKPHPEAATRLTARLRAAAATPSTPAAATVPHPPPAVTPLAPPSPGRLSSLPIPTANIPPLPPILQHPSQTSIDVSAYMSTPHGPRLNPPAPPPATTQAASWSPRRDDSSPLTTLQSQPPLASLDSSEGATDDGLPPTGQLGGVLGWVGQGRAAGGVPAEGGQLGAAAGADPGSRPERVAQAGQAEQLSKEGTLSEVHKLLELQLGLPGSMTVGSQ